MNDPRLEEFSVVRNITAHFPPIFISVGNADGLAPQSQLLAELDLRPELDILVDSLFFPNGYTPPVSHGGQLNSAFCRPVKAER